MDVWLRSVRGRSLFRLGKAHPVVLPVKHSVVLADEDVSQDPQGPCRGGDVQTHEAAQTHCLSGLTDLFGKKGEESETRRDGLPTCRKINEKA